MSPTPGMPGWLPDPTGRHELRWFDGAAFTDQVADAGVQGTDDGSAAAPPPVPPAAPLGVAVGAPPWSTPPGAGAEPGPWAAPAPAAPGGGRRFPVVPVAVVGALVAAGIVGFVVLGGDEGTGAGTFTGSVSDDAPVSRHAVRIPAGSVAVVTVRPDDDLDAVVSFAVGEDTADELEDLYGDTAFSFEGEGRDPVDAVDLEEDAASTAGLDEQLIVFRSDVGFAGDPDRTFLAAPFAVDAQVLVTAFTESDGSRSEGDYEIEIAVLDLDLGDDPDGNDVLDAVADADGVPDAIADAITERD